MVQIIPRANQVPSRGQRVSQALSQALIGGLQMYGEHQKKKQFGEALQNIEGAYSNPDLNEQQRLIKTYQQLAGAGHPELAQKLGAQLSGLGQKNIANTANAAEDQKRYDVIKQNFGPRAAELYRASPEGGKTQFLGSLLEANQRGLNFEDLINPQFQGNQQPPGYEQTEMPGMNRQTDGMGRPTEAPKFGPEKGAIKAIDYDRGLTPKERVRRQDDRYSKNLPLYQESQKKMQGIESEKDALNTLSELSPQIGALQRLNINPETGELFIPGLASPEAQRFTKTVNDFTVKAKDSYGSRVSNFELDRFMKRLPTLANSEEGRNQIIRQMQIINSINSARENALQDVFDEHGGIRNIDYDKAERLADKQSKGQVESLRKEFKSIDNSLDQQYQQKIKEKKKAAPKGFVLMEHEGQFGYVPPNEVKKAITEGAKLL